MASFIERCLWLYKYLIGAIVILGLVFAVKSGDHHWINRMGALIVTCSLGLTLAQFVFESKRPKQIDERKIAAAVILENKGLSAEDIENTLKDLSGNLNEGFERARRRILIMSLIVVAFGEILHGFGDLILDGVLELIRSALDCARALMGYAV